MTLGMTTEDAAAASQPQAIEAGHQEFTFLNAHEAIELGRCEAVVEKGLAAFLDVGQALWQIRQSRLYRENHSTFEEYVEARWLMSKSQAYRLISATEVVHQIEEAGSPIGDNGDHLLPSNAAQARPLSQLPIHQRPEAWAKAVEQSGGQPTAAVVQEIVTGMLPPKPEKTDRAVAPLFEVEEIPETQSGFASPGPAVLETNAVRDADMTDEEWESSVSRPASAADALANLNAQRDDAVKGWSQDEDNQNQDNSAQNGSDAAHAAGRALDAAASTEATGETEAIDDADDPAEDDSDAPGPAAGVPTPDAVPGALHGQAHPAPPVSPNDAAAANQKPADADKADVAVAPKPAASAKSEAPAKLAPAPGPAAPTLPAGFTTAIVKEADFKKAQELGLWPLANAIDVYAEMQAQIDTQAEVKAQIEELGDKLGEELGAAAPPSPAMVVAGVSATRLAEINETAGTVLYHAETQLLNEMFPERETTGPDHIVAVLVTIRLREMTAKATEE